MDTLKILERIEAINTEVYELGEADGSTTITEDDSAAPMDADEFEAYAERLHALSPSLAAFFRSAGEITFAWRSPIAETEGGVTHVEGRLSIPTAAFIFDQGYWEALGNTHGPLFAIDKFSAEWWAVMRPNHATIWLCEPGTDQLFDTGLSFDTWFELGCEVRFFSGWLFAFVPALAGGDEVREALETHGKALFETMNLEAFDRLRAGK